MKNVLKKILGIVMILLCIGVMVLLYYVLGNKLLSKVNFSKEEEAIVLDLQKKIASEKSIDAVLEKVSYVSVNTYEENFKVTYPFKYFKTNVIVETTFDYDFNILEYEYCNNSGANALLIILYGIASTVATVFFFVKGADLLFTKTKKG